MRISCLLLVVLISACGRGSTSSDDDDVECSAPADCPNMACECSDTSTPINTRQCVNGSCQEAEDACPVACDSFDAGNWTGRVSYPTGSSSSGGAHASSSAASACQGFFLSNACGTCGEAQCCAEGGACHDNASCENIISCTVSCVRQGAAQSYCESECKRSFSSGAAAFDAYNRCMDEQCFTPCH